MKIDEFIAWLMDIAFAVLCYGWWVDRIDLITVWFSFVSAFFARSLVENRRRHELEKIKGVDK